MVEILEFTKLNLTKSFIFVCQIGAFALDYMIFLHFLEISVSTCNGTFSGSFV